MDFLNAFGLFSVMAMLIFYTNVGARAVHTVIARGLDRRTQAWRRR